MAGFEDSIEYKMAMQAYQKRQKSLNAAKSFMQSAKELCSTKKVSAAVSKVKETVGKWFSSKKSQAADKTQSAGEKKKSSNISIKGFFNKLSKSIQDKMDTAYKGLLVAKEGVTKAMKPVKTVAKATAHTFAMAAGATIGGAALGAEKLAEFGQRGMNKAAELGQRGMDAARQFGQRGMDAARQVGDNVVRGVGKVKSVAKEGAARFSAGAKKLYTTAGNAYTANAIAGKRTFRAAVRGVKETVGNWYNNVKNRAEDKAYDMGEKMKSAKGSVKGFFNKLSKSIQGKMNTAYQSLLVAKDGVTKAMKPVKTVAKATAHTFAMAAGATIGGAALGAEKMAEFGQRGMNKAAELGQRGMDAARQVGDNVVRGVGKVKSVAKEGAARFSAGAKKLYSDFGDQYNKQADKIKGSYQSVKGAFMKKFKNMALGAYIYADNKRQDMSEAKTKVGGKIKGFFNKVSGFGKDTLKKVGKNLQPVKTVAKATAHTFAAAAGATIGGAALGAEKMAEFGQRGMNKAAELGQRGMDAARQVKDTVTRGVGQVKTVVKVGADRAKGFLSDKKTKITLAGKSFGKNVVNALNSQKERAYRAVSNTMTSAGKAINRNIENVKTNVQTMSRSNSSAWFKQAYASAKSR